MTRIQRAYLADVDTVYLSNVRYPYEVAESLYLEYKSKFPGEYFYD